VVSNPNVGEAAPSSNAPSASGAVAANPNAVLAQAQADLARRYFQDAQNRAESLLSARVSAGVRAAALLVAADAAYGMSAYPVAATRYGEFVTSNPSSPDAPRAAMRLGWAQYRQGNPAAARQSWTALANRYPSDWRAPLALALAAEVASQAADVGEARVLADRVVMRYATSPYAPAARLSRAILAMRQHREADAVRDLDELVKHNGARAVEERQRLVTALAGPRTELALEEQAGPVVSVGTDVAASPGPSTNSARVADDPLDRFIVAIESRDRASAPFVIHGLLLGAAAERGWSSPRAGALAVRLADDFPAYPPAPALLTRVAQQSTADGQWPMARKAYESLAAHYPSPNGKTDLDLAEALYRSGDPAAARARLQKAATAGGPGGAPALLKLAEISEASGDKRAALTAYDTLLRDYPGQARQPESLLAHARLLEEFGPAYRARAVLRAVAESDRSEAAAEASYRLGQMLAREGQHREASEWYTRAATSAPGSKWERMALLGAGDSFVQLRHYRQATTTYDRLLKHSDTATRAEATYRMGTVAHDEGRHRDAANLYLQAAQLVPGSPTEPRALVGAVKCLVAAGDRKTADSVYQRLVQAPKTAPDDLAAARTALRVEPPRPATPEPRPAIKEWREVDENSAAARR
jgi:TolA-binding protein